MPAPVRFDIFGAIRRRIAMRRPRRPRFGNATRATRHDTMRCDATSPVTRYAARDAIPRAA
ncbi:hypothetical protein WG70_13235 [Burkholderia oklahomensis EO147]|nr:hypothetical protein WG70_13235 [Burkholderia oklahomensis EO147]KUY55554.1 hypothetical protein WG70_12030 [Burkholderia oklahomensis EO147]